MKKEWWLTGMAALLVISVLSGCGTKPTKDAAAAQASQGQGASQAPAGDASKKEPAADESKGSKAADRGDNLKKLLEKQGVSPAQADELEKLAQSNHVQPKWISDRLKAGAKAGDVIADIKAGKAPVRDNDARDGSGQGKKDKAKDGTTQQGTSGGNKMSTQG